MPDETKVAKKPIAPGQAYSRRQFLAASSVLSYALLPLSIIRGRDAVAQSVSFDYYISPTGSDNNPGTVSQPWAITAINTKRSLYAGKRVGLLDGTYYVAALAAGFQDSDRIILDVASGTPSSPTIIQAVNPRKAIIDGTDGSGNRVNRYYAAGCGVIGQTYLSSGDVGNFVLRGLVIRKGYRYLVHFRYTGGIQNGPRFPGVLVDSCEIYDINMDGRGTGDNIALIQAVSLDGLTVRNCNIYNARGDRTVDDANGYGIITWSSNNSVFEYNSIKDCKDGIYVKNAYQTGCIIRNNFIDLTAYDGPGSTNAIFGLGFSSAGVQHVTAQNNVLVAQNGWRVVGDLATGLQGPCQFFNNTVVASGTDFLTCGVEMLGKTYAESFYNNILYHSAASNAEEGDYAFNIGNTGKVDYNCYPKSPKLCSAPNGVLYPTISYSTLAAVASAFGFEAHSKTADPLFVGAGSSAERFQLQSGSACKGAGRSGGVSSGAVTDIGAWGGGASQIGCDFTQSVPVPPHIQVS